MSEAKVRGDDQALAPGSCAQGRGMVQEELSVDGTCEIGLPFVRTDLFFGQDIETIRESYKSRFNQESVLRVDADVCVSF